MAQSLALTSLLLAGTASAADHDSNPLADHVREATARLQDVKIAIAEGYTPIPCVSGVDGGAMGVHYVNVQYIKDEVIDIRRPQAVMYEPTSEGNLVPIGVEYISFKGPASLEGHLFAFNGAPNRYGLDPFYELHVWAWRPNPHGMFTDMNPNVTCDHMPAQAD
jgi:hypothetical protein